MNTFALDLAALGAFFAGSIPFGYLIGRAFYGIDIRRSGSGNIGAMNVLRTTGKSGAVAVLILDACKGFIPAIVALHFSGDLRVAAIVAFAAVLGHCFSPWLTWRGGKGVATSFGAVFALSWPAGVSALAGWVLGALCTTYSSVGSLLGSVLAAVALWFFTRNAWCTAYGIAAALLIFFTHRDNIARLRSGNESGISFLKGERKAR